MDTAHVSKKYLLVGDRVRLHQKQGDFFCVEYRSNLGKSAFGWLPSDVLLVSLPMAPVASRTGLAPRKANESEVNAFFSALKAYALKCNKEKALYNCPYNYTKHEITQIRDDTISESGMPQDFLFLADINNDGVVDYIWNMNTGPKFYLDNTMVFDLVDGQLQPVVGPAPESGEFIEYTGYADKWSDETLKVEGGAVVMKREGDTIYDQHHQEVGIGDAEFTPGPLTTKHTSGTFRVQNGQLWCTAYHDRTE